MNVCLLLFDFDRSLDSVKHFPLVLDGKKFVFGIGEFCNVEQLVEHFQNYPIMAGETGFDDYFDLLLTENVIPSLM